MVSSPKRGAARWYCAGVADNFTGIPTVRTLPATGWSCSTTMPRASVCGCDSACAIECPGPAGTPASSKTSSPSCALRVSRMADISATSSSRLFMRSRLRA
ncbi:hypothetical protein G6F68_018883 [Rhizopus microsporus]|nr:hypothetical protein G6F68_018883 [Rhizopus microsporus]